jgi:hypothetical protein
MVADLADLADDATSRRPSKPSLIAKTGLRVQHLPGRHLLEARKEPGQLMTGMLHLVGLQFRRRGIS